MPKNIENIQEFNTLINQTDTVVAVDFWAPWCGPCKALAPILDQAAAAIGSSGEIAKVNVDDLSDIARNYGVSSIPTVIYFRNGKEVHRATGIEPEETIVSHFKRLAQQPV
jgi:thioredoxin 1